MSSKSTRRPVRVPSVALPRGVDAEPIRLLSGAVVTVLLLDSDGRPRPGVTVIVDSGEEAAEFGETDGDGRYRNNTLVPGECWIQVDLDMPAERILLRIVDGPSGAPVAGALVRSSRGGSNLRSDKDGRVAVDVAEMGESELVVVSPDGGSFLLGLAPGRYRLRVTAEDFADYEGDIQVGPDGLRKVIRLAPE